MNVHLPLYNQGETYEVVRPRNESTSPPHLPYGAFTIVQDGLAMPEPSLLTKNQIPCQTTANERPRGAFRKVRLHGNSTHWSFHIKGVRFGGR
jgi:hypothetical protein